MTSPRSGRLNALVVDAAEPAQLAAFWAGLLGREVDGTTVLPTDATEFPLRFRAGPPRGSGPNQIHLHLTSTSPLDMAGTVERALGLGATHLDVGQLPEEGHVVLADPDGNEFCVLPPGNSFLAGCGFLAEVASDGTRAVGVFWSEALEWPLVWDEDEETAIQSPAGGAKVAWGGPPLAERDGPPRYRLEVVADEDRLIALGATREGDTWRDPDGNEFLLAGPGQS